MGYTRMTTFTCDSSGCQQQFHSFWTSHEMALTHAKEHGWVFKLNGALSFCKAHALSMQSTTGAVDE